MLELPQELVLVLSGFIGFVVAEGLQSLSRLVGRDLSGEAAGLSAALVSLAVASINGALLHVPPEFVPYVQGVIAFLVVVLAPFAIHSALNKFRAKK